MASINKVIIVGNLGADPETRFLPSGEAVTNIRVATTDRWKDKGTGRWTGKVFVAIDPGEGSLRSKGIASADVREAA